MLLRCALACLALATAFVAKAERVQLVRHVKPSYSAVLYALYKKAPLGGYYPLQLEVSNETSQAQRWNVWAECSPNYGYEVKTSVEESFEILPGESAMFEVLLPMFSYAAHEERSQDIENMHYNIGIRGGLSGPGG
ncbi:MAG: hypothetical protein AAGB46_12925, partial [Verrucomicrobiota bacterium]